MEKSQRTDEAFRKIRLLRHFCIFRRIVCSMHLPSHWHRQTNLLRACRSCDMINNERKPFCKIRISGGVYGIIRTKNEMA